MRSGKRIALPPGRETWNAYKRGLTGTFDEVQQSPGAAIRRAPPESASKGRGPVPPAMAFGWARGSPEGAAGGRGGKVSVRTFGDYLRHFARSVDIVDERILEEVRKLVYTYVRDELEAAYFSLAYEQTVDGRAGLRTFWSTEDEEHATTIRTPAGEYSSQISVAFGENKPLWVVNEAQHPLRRPGEYVDLWSGVANLPRYEAPIDKDMRTSIIVPMVHWSRVLGVIYLESTSYLDVTDVAKDELTLLADALAILFELRQANRAQVAGTRAAVIDLENILKGVRFPRLAKPQIFVAFPVRAPDEVIGVIQEVLAEFGDSLRVVQWNKIEESGSITLDLVKNIASSRFGLCYFSEPKIDGQGGFTDSVNVIFEAGMLHSLTNSSEGKLDGWIPIREKLSPPVPFDFASERILIIARNKDGELMEERFRSDLRKRVTALVHSGIKG
jgi:hypothetical protein